MSALETVAEGLQGTIAGEIVLGAIARIAELERQVAALVDVARSAAALYGVATTGDEHELDN